MDIQTLAAALAIGGKRSAGMIAGDYDPGKTYALGAIVIYNGALYENTTAINTPEEWNPEHWTQRTLDYFLGQISGEHVRFGVSGVGESSPELTRLWDAVDMPTPTPGTDTTPASSAFDAFAPFNRKKCVGSWALSDGKAKFTVNAYYGDPDYAEDGSAGNYVAVEVDPFYYFEGGGVLGVSTHQYPGWSVHPVCLDLDGNVREHTYLPCYQVGLVDGAPVSLPGVWPENGSYAQLMAKLRAYSTDLANQVMLEPSAVNHYEWSLYTIEFATQNCQSVMMGAANLRHSNDLITAAPAANQIVMAKSIAQNYVLGQTISLTSSIWDNPTPSTAYCQIMSLALCDEDGTPNEAGSYYLVTYSGEDRSSSIAIGTTKCASRPWVCGATQGYAPGIGAVIGHTGSPISNASGKYPCIYRYRENIFGNQNLTSMDLFDVLGMRATRPIISNGTSWTIPASGHLTRLRTLQLQTCRIPTRASAS